MLNTNLHISCMVLDFPVHAILLHPDNVQNFATCLCSYALHNAAHLPWTWDFSFDNSVHGLKAASHVAPNQGDPVNILNGTIMIHLWLPSMAFDINV